MITGDATSQLEALRAGSIDAGQLMALTLDRIAATNPSINAVVALRDRDTLLAEAAQADHLSVGGALGDGHVQRSPVREPDTPRRARDR